MKTRPFAITALTSAIICGPAIAENEATRGNRDVALELTMTLIPTDAKTSAAVTAIIELPNELTADDTSTHGGERAALGLDTANLAREAGRAFGEAVAAAARGNRETASRASRADGNQPPPTTPNLPDRPALPSR